MNKLEYLNSLVAKWCKENNIKKTIVVESTDNLDKYKIVVPIMLTEDSLSAFVAWPHQILFITPKLLNDLSITALVGVTAHEFSHLVNDKWHIILTEIFNFAAFFFGFYKYSGAYFQRQREYNADKYAAKIAGKNTILAALCELLPFSSSSFSLLDDHPKMEHRIERLSK